MGLGLVLAAARLEKTEQVVLSARAICVEDLLPDPSLGWSAGEARWSGHHSEHEGWMVIQGDDGCLYVFLLVYVSAGVYLAGGLFRETVCQEARS